MTRFEITFHHTGSILDPKGMIERIIAQAPSPRAHIVVYVAAENVVKFKKLLDGDDQVKEYLTHPVDRKSRLMTAI